MLSTRARKARESEDCARWWREQRHGLPSGSHARSIRGGSRVATAAAAAAVALGLRLLQRQSGLLLLLCSATARTLSGATRISYFLLRMRKKVRSFCGSSERTAERARPHSCVMSVASAFDIFSSSVERMGMQSWLTMTMPCTPLCELMRFSVSSTSDIAAA